MTTKLAIRAGSTPNSAEWREQAGGFAETASSRALRVSLCDIPHDEKVLLSAPDFCGSNSRLSRGSVKTAVYPYTNLINLNGSAADHQMVAQQSV